MERGSFFGRGRFAFIKRIKENLGLFFYTRKQKYHVNYSVRVSNASSKSRDFQIILPLPQETEYQHILKQPVFSPGEFSFLKDSAYGNFAAIYNGTLQSGETQELKMLFEVLVLPRKTEKRKGKQQESKVCKHLFLGQENDLRDLMPMSTETDETEEMILRKLNDSVIDKLEYGDPIPGLYTAKDALSRDRVDCGGFDSLLAAVAIRRGYKAEIVSGFWAGYKKNPMHAWLEVELPGGVVVPLDPSVEKLAAEGRTHKSGRFGFLGSDRIVFARGCCLPFLINGQEVKVDLLQNPYLMPHDPDLRAELSFSAERL